MTDTEREIAMELTNADRVEWLTSLSLYANISENDRKIAAEIAGVLARDDSDASWLECVADVCYRESAKFEQVDCNRLRRIAARVRSLPLPYNHEDQSP